MENKILIAGFGGQGVLFLGKLIAYSGLIGNKEVSWLPSYGPEMRGGTANCSVILSDSPVGSPIVSKPDVLIPMNLPSLEKFENAVNEGGFIIYDSSLIQKDVKNDKAFGIPATKIANETGYHGLANMILFGYVLKKTNMLSLDLVNEGIKKVVPAKKAHLLPKNIEAIMLVYNYEG